MPYLYLSNEIEVSFRQAFNTNDLLINCQADHVIIENSQAHTEEKIREIIESVGFCPLISPSKINGNFAFTIVPYKIPDCFYKAQDFQFACDNFPTSRDLKIIETNKTDYFSLNEISRLLEKVKFINEKKINFPKDKWSQVNDFRSFVLPALNRGLSEIVARSIRNECPIVEIGSGIGYSLSQSLSSKIVRIQPSIEECQLLRETIPDPIYQIDIDGLYNSLAKIKKKISLFFALNVFDTMSPAARRTSFLQLSQLQNIGDRILVMLDTNPYLTNIVKDLENLHPNHVLLPYFPLKNNCAKLSVLIVPLDKAPFGASADELFEMINMEAILNMQGYISPLQHKLHCLQKELSLKVVELEVFFTEQVKQELEQTGYKTNAYYHASFSTGEISKNASEVKQDLIYKSVTDTATVRQWSLSDQNLVNWLDKKHLKLPSYFTEAFLYDLRKKNHRIFGAEILVIEAKKLGLED